MSGNTTTTNAGPETVLTFWEEAGHDRWFQKDADFDAEIRSRFSAIHHAARIGRLDHWNQTPHGALALVILLDQFSRNIFRDDPKAFENDMRALGIAHEAIRKGFDGKIAMPLRLFFYLPFEHSEQSHDQDECIRLVEKTGDEEALKWAKVHADIIARFGRFPHRNKILGRESTPAEDAFLKDGGFAG